jgi:hypothetical protein
VDKSGDQTRGGADFFDADKRYRGWARQITQRAPLASGLTAIDVIDADADLIPFLTRLDHSVLVVTSPGTGETLFRFRWASGYENGKDIRIQGALEAGIQPRARMG